MTRRLPGVIILLLLLSLPIINTASAETSQVGGYEIGLSISPRVPIVDRANTLTISINDATTKQPLESQYTITINTPGGGQALQRNFNAPVGSSTFVYKFPSSGLFDVKIEVTSVEGNEVDPATANFEVNIRSSATGTGTFAVTEVETTDTARNKDTEFEVGSLIIVSANLQNNSDSSNSFLYVVQVKDANDQIITSPVIISDQLASNAERIAGPSVRIMQPGVYTAEIFIWEDFVTLSPLAPPESISFTVTN